MRSRKRFIYIATDWDHDKNAAEELYKWREAKGWEWEFCDTHEMTQQREHAEPCMIKVAMKKRLLFCQIFVFIVGDHTDTAIHGECKTCDSYNSYLGSCKKNRFMDPRCYMKLECDLAVRAEKKIIVFYKSTSVDKTKCPPELRDVGIHAAMVYKGQDNRKYWDYDAVNQVIVDCIDAR